MSTNDIELPPLPRGYTDGSALAYGDVYDDEHMQAYARAAVEADRQARGEQVKVPSDEEIEACWSGEPMSLNVALDFADNPRPFPSLAAPADTNGELYKALRVLASKYRALLAKYAKES